MNRLDRIRILNLKSLDYCLCHASHINRAVSLCRLFYHPKILPKTRCGDDGYCLYCIFLLLSIAINTGLLIINTGLHNRIPGILSEYSLSGIFRQPTLCETSSKDRRQRHGTTSASNYVQPAIAETQVYALPGYCLRSY